MRRKIGNDHWHLKTCMVIFHPFFSGVIDHVDMLGCYVSYMALTKQIKLVHPKEAEFQEITFEQVICCDIPAPYIHSIRCNVSQDMVEKIDAELTTI